MKRFLAPAGLGAVVAAPGTAQVNANPAWSADPAREPSAPELERYYPARARDQGIRSRPVQR